MATKNSDAIRRSASARFSDSARVVEENTNAAVMASAVEQIAIDNNKLAVALRDKGKIEEARTVLNDNAAYLSESAKKYNAPELEKYSTSNEEDAKKLDSSSW